MTAVIDHGKAEYIDGGAGGGHWKIRDKKRDEKVIRKLGQAVRRAFDSRLIQRLPQFVNYKPAVASGATAGCRYYRCAVAPDLCFYLLLDMHGKRDAFTVEIAWATVDEWVPHQMVFGLDEVPNNGIFHFRLTHLLEDSHTDLWWEFARTRTSGVDAELLVQSRIIAPLSFDFDGKQFIEESAEARASFVKSSLDLVQPAVDDAVARICKYALPYFGETSKARGHAARWEHAMRG